MIDVKKRAGRLVTLRFLPPVSEEEFERFDAEMADILRTSTSPVIFCTDLRGAAVFTDTLALRIISSMRRSSPRMKRSALLLPSDGAILTLQFERIVREAGSAARRTFRKSQEAVAWLGEVLYAGEREGLAEFIAEWLPGVGLMSPPSSRAPVSLSAPMSSGFQDAAQSQRIPLSGAQSQRVPLSAGSQSQRAPLSGAALEGTPSPRSRRFQR